jgi:hypothetical protein
MSKRSDARDDNVLLAYKRLTESLRKHVPRYETEPHIAARELFVGAGRAIGHKRLMAAADRWIQKEKNNG